MHIHVHCSNKLVVETHDTICIVCLSLLFTRHAQAKNVVAAIGRVTVPRRTHNVRCSAVKVTAANHTARAFLLPAPFIHVCAHIVLTVSVRAFSLYFMRFIAGVFIVPHIFI